MSKKQRQGKATGLRNEAEQRVRCEDIDPQTLSRADVDALCYELRVHQVELEMQNEQLRQSQVELEISRSRYADLFDFAPIGYFIFDTDGCITQLNLTAAAMVRRDRRALNGKPFRVLLAPADRDTFHQHRLLVTRTGGPHECVVRLLRADAGERVVRLRSRSVTDAQVVYCRTAAIDISKQTEAEQALREAHDGLETQVHERTAELNRAVATLQEEAQQRIEAERQLGKLNEELLLTEERERRRIATALHDSIGQFLALSKRELGALRKDTPEPLLEKLDHVRTQIDEAIGQTRSLTFELSPSTLYTFGLEAAVEELAEQFSQREGFACHLDAQDGEQTLSEPIRILLYRAVRELLMNVTKHAAAKNVSIRIQRANERIRVDVEDDGAGFDLSTLESHQSKRMSFGLFSLRERLSRIGGAFRIESVIGDGTKVTLEAPL